jgi:hypothetical protein
MLRYKYIACLVRLEMVGVYCAARTEDLSILPINRGKGLLAASWFSKDT